MKNILWSFYKQKNDNRNMEEKCPHRTLSVVSAILSTLVSLFIAGYCFYISSLGVFWFIPIGSYFALECLFIIIPLFQKDEYQAMRLQGIFQIITVVLIMPYLLFMILWNDANGIMDYSFFTYGAFAISAALKVIISLIGHIALKKNYQPLLHAYRNNGYIAAFYLGIIVELIVINQYYPGKNTEVFDQILQQKELWTYILSIGVNAISTIVAALLALSTEIRAKTKEEFTTTGKIKHTIKWFNDNEVSMFFGLIFTMYLAILALINMKQSIFYILLFAYYVGTALIRFINYIWHKGIQKKCGDNQIKDNRQSSWILLFDAFAYLLFSNVLVVGAIFMMIQKANTGANIYLFLFMIVPMAIMRFITSNKSVKRNRKENNTYKLGISLIGVVSLFFTILEIVAIVCHEMNVIFRFVVIIGAIIAVKIAVIMVAIIFVVHWLRSIVLNSRRKERRLAKQKDVE